LTDLAVETVTLANGTLTAGLPPATYDVIATLGDQSFIYANGYVVSQAEVLAPSLSSIEPNSAPAGQAVEVTLAGENFADGMDVYIGGRNASSVRVRSTQQATAVSPSTLSEGVYDVEIENPDGQSDSLRGGWQVTAGPDPGASPDSGCCSQVASRSAPVELGLAVLGLVIWAGRRRRGVSRQR
jgi:hypothetical protein